MVSAGKRVVMLRLMQADPRRPPEMDHTVSNESLEKTYGTMADQMIELILDGPDSRGIVIWSEVRC